MDKDRLEFAALVGVGTMLLDLAFHTLATSPEETPLYFVAKLALAFVTAFAVYDHSGLNWALAGGVAFTALTGVYYALAYYFQNPALSCCFLSPPQVFGLPYIAFFQLGYLAVSTWLLAFAFVHFVAFVVSYLAVEQRFG